MVLHLDDVRLPIRQIRDANLDWVRSDASEQDDALLTSLQEQGMQLPLLLTNELVVADGARRLLAAERLGWRDVPVIVTTDWEVVRQYFQTVRRLNAEGALPYKPMTWAEIVDLVAGPLDLLYQRRRLERGRRTRAERAANGRTNDRSGEGARKNDYVAEAAEALGWKRSDLRSVRGVYWALSLIEATEAANRKAAHQEGDAGAAEKLLWRAESLRGEAVRLENDGGTEGGLYSLLRKLRWIAAGNDPAVVKTGRAKRKVGEPTMAERRAAAAANPLATGREMDAPTLTRLIQVLTGLGAEVDAYTHVRPSVRIDDARTAAKDIKAAVNQFNRLGRVLKAYADNLEESS